MSSTDIVREIERETAAELDRLLASADQRATEIVEAAVAEVRRRAEAAIVRAEPAVRAEARRRANAARLRLNERRLEMALARTAAVHAAAADRLQAITTCPEQEPWAAALVRLTREALDLAGPGASVRVRRRDTEIVGELVRAHGGRLEPDGDDAPAGVVAISADGRIEVDATIPVRLDRAWARLAEDVARRLGLGT
jgi:vacuolar-type H+-ATPase subunit E/Vma4